MQDSAYNDCIILNNRRIQSTNLYHHNNNNKFLPKTDPPTKANTTFQIYTNQNKQQQQQQHYREKFEGSNLHSGNSSSSSFEGSSSFHSLSSNSTSSLSAASCSINAEKCTPLQQQQQQQQHCIQHEPCRCCLDYKYCMRRGASSKPSLGSTEKLMDLLTDTSSSSSSSNNFKPDNDMFATTVNINSNFVCLFVDCCIIIINVRWNELFLSCVSILYSRDNN